jgi:hypothetical protein
MGSLGAMGPLPDLVGTVAALRTAITWWLGFTSQHTVLGYLTPVDFSQVAFQQAAYIFCWCFGASPPLPCSIDYPFYTSTSYVPPTSRNPLAN